MKYGQTIVYLCLNHTNLALKLKAPDTKLSGFDDADPYHFVEKYATTDVGALLVNIADPLTVSEWKLIQMENGSTKISVVAEDISAADSENTFY